MKANYYQDGGKPIEVDTRPAKDGKTADIYLSDTLVVSKAPVTEASAAQPGSVVLADKAAAKPTKPQLKKAAADARAAADEAAKVATVAQAAADAAPEDEAKAAAAAEAGAAAVAAEQAAQEAEAAAK